MVRQTKFNPYGLRRAAVCKVPTLRGGTLRGCDFIVPITLRVIFAVQKPLVFEATSRGA